MLYGLGAADVLTPAVHALPDCLSQDLADCLNHGTGLPKAQCNVIRAPYAAGVDQKTTDAMDDAVNALPICTGPSMVPYVGLAFAAGALLAGLVLRR